MKSNKAAEQALVTILNGIYGEIYQIEEKSAIRLNEGDYRPRIEYFHDAVRALTGGDLLSKRLTVEFIAYDVSMLRFIQANPLVRSKGTKLNLSPGTALITGNEPEFAIGKSTTVKGQLMELYKNYSVLFVALLSGPADRDYQTKINDCNEEVETIASIEAEVKAAGSSVNIEELVQTYIDDPVLAQKILAAMGGSRKKMQANDALKKLSDMIKTADKQLKATEQAHFTFATSQLAIYENARDVVKKMAVSGMNIVGNFVENAVQEARSSGRGM